MAITAPSVNQEEAQRRDEFAGRLFELGLHTFELFTVYLDDRLGLYRALAAAGPARSADLARRTGTYERYAREWLGQQAVAGILAVDDVHAEPGARRYRLPSGHAEVLVERDSLNYLAPLARAIVGNVSPLPAILRAFLSGGGVPHVDYGPDGREGQGDLTRPMFINLLGSEWLPAIPDVHARLQADPPARVADIACGTGWSSIALARAYPEVRADGFASDEPAIALARAAAAETDLADRVSFQVRDAADPSLSGGYDLVTVFEALHDLARPVEALRTIRNLVAAGGAVIIADERVAETFTAPGDEVERFMYGASVLFCLPTGLAEQPSAGTGTAMHPATLRRYVEEAGFREVEILPIEHAFWRFYRLRP